MKVKKRKLKDKLLDKYRLVILNDNTFEEKLSLNLTRLNVFVFVGFSAIALIVLTSILIAFTPLREYIPGYSSTALKKKAHDLAKKTDSLTLAITIQEKQLNSIRKILTGDVMPSEKEESSKKVAVNTSKFEPIPASKEDSLLRAQVEQEDKYNILDTEKQKANFVLFPPVKGEISNNFDVKNKHFAVDVVVAENTPVKSVADGTVVFSEWTVQTGNVIIIEHSNHLISVYKHNAILNKQQGDLVKAGEVIALSGNTGELTNGPHLHFELWGDGYPLNPTDFINFKL